MHWSETGKRRARAFLALKSIERSVRLLRQAIEHRMPANGIAHCQDIIDITSTIRAELEQKDDK